MWYQGDIAIKDIRAKLKSFEISSARNFLLSRLIVLIVYTLHDTITALLCAKFQNDLSTDMIVMEEWDLAISEFKFLTDILPAAAFTNMD